MSQPAVQVEQLSYTFAGRTAPTLVDVSFDLKPGCWTLLTGRTGSGKSTLLRALSGLIPHHTAGTMQGRVQFYGRDLAETPPAKLAGEVGLVQQSPDDQICTTTVAAEVAFGLENLALPGGEIAARIEASLRQVGMLGLRDRKTGQLSGGQKQRLMLAAVLAMRPRLLLLDEPLSQLDPQAAADLLAELERLRELGLTIVLVEHRLDDLLSRVDRLIVLDQGRLRSNMETTCIAEVEAALSAVNLELPEWMQLARRLHLGPFRQSSELLEALGRGVAPRESSGTNAVRHQPDGELPPPCICAEGLGFRFSPQSPFVWQQVSFHLRPGDRVALVGANGAGKSTLLAVLAGLLPVSAGSLFMVDRRIGLVFQNPDLMLFNQSVFDELAFGPRQWAAKADHSSLNDRVLRTAELFSLTELLDEPPQALSQGQRLRTAVAAALTSAPRLLLLDEPTTGQDQRQVTAILEALSRHLASAQEIDVVLFSTHDLRTVARFAHRVLVLGQGRLLADCSPHELMTDGRLLAEANLRPPPLIELRIALGLSSGTLDELVAELRR